MATTASILAVFVPVATMKGMIGRFFVQFGLTVAFAVSVSLFVAFTLTPMLSSRFLRAQTGKGPLGQAIERFLNVIDVALPQGAGGCAQASWSYRAGRSPGLRGQHHAGLRVAEGIHGHRGPQHVLSKDRTTQRLLAGGNEAFTESIANKLRTVPGVKETLVTIGGTTQSEINRSEIQVNLVKRHQRKFTSGPGHRVRAQAVLPSWPTARTSNCAVEPFNFTGGGNAAFRSAMLQFNVRGRNYDEISKAPTN